MTVSQIRHDKTIGANAARRRPQLPVGAVFCPYGYLPSSANAEPAERATDSGTNDLRELTPCDLKKLSQEAASRRRGSSSKQFLTASAGIAALAATIVAAVCVISTPHTAYVQQPDADLEVSGMSAPLSCSSTFRIARL